MKLKGDCHLKDVGPVDCITLLLPPQLRSQDLVWSSSCFRINTCLWPALSDHTPQGLLTLMVWYTLGSGRSRLMDATVAWFIPLLKRCHPIPKMQRTVSVPIIVSYEVVSINTHVDGLMISSTEQSTC
jgi:hypothetical protein